MKNEILRNVQIIQERAARAAERSGRKPEDIALMAVTKTVPAEQIQAAYEAGIRLFGENRVQEAREKASQLPDDCVLHLIGHLQRNKAKHAAEIFSAVQSIDRAETASALSRAIAARGGEMDVLLEVNTSGEESKFGVRNRDDLFSTIDSVLFLPGLRIRGLMTIAPFTSDSVQVRTAFRKLKDLSGKAAERYPDQDFSMLSMGMSSDFETAIEEGSTLIRIGTAIFGGRG